MASWDIEYTDQFGSWWATLMVDEQRAIAAAMELLSRDGPALGRPIVDTLTGSRHPNMKEVRPPATHLRVFFAFDPRRMAILLIGGNKEHRWQEWYRTFIPVADNLYDQHLQELRREGKMK